MSSLIIEAEIRKLRTAWEQHEKAKQFHTAEAQRFWFELIAAKNRLRAAKIAEAGDGVALIAMAHPGWPDHKETE